MADFLSFRNFPRILSVGGLVFKSRRMQGLRAINKTGSSIAADKLVAISGYDSTSKLPKIVLADADSADLATDVYVTPKAIANNSNGIVLKGATSAATLNTNSASAVGDPVYLSQTAGAFTVTAPTDGNARVQVVGYVHVKSATVGQIAWDVKPPTKLGSSDINITSGRVTAQAATSGTIATLTPTADGSFDVVANVLVTTATTHTFNVLCTYTDEGNTARSVILPFRLVGSTTALVSSVANGNGTVPYIGVPVRIRAKAGNAITILTDSGGTYTTVVYNAEGTIRQVA